ncbi:MAG TPA: hypothetical protein VK064_06435, partial [Wenzhouxiangella sp.]|nr:hypothetical protein [Wenzhouxiangella sp.]
HLAGDEIIVARGQVRFDDYRGGFRIVADEVYSVDEAREKFARRVEITINRSDEVLVQDLAAALRPYRGGDTPVVIQYRNRQARAVVTLGDGWKVAPSAELMAALGGVEKVESARLRY